MSEVRHATKRNLWSLDGMRVWLLTSFLCVCGCADKIDLRTLCPEEGPGSTTVLILDMSDPLKPHQLNALNRFADSLVKKIPAVDGVLRPSENYIPKGHMLVVFELATVQNEPRERFRMCNPGSPDERRAIDGFTEGEIASVVKWSQFSKAMQAAVPNEVGTQSATTSPIIETVRFVRNKEFPRAVDMNGQGEPRRYTIFVISDLLQNSDLLSHYDGLPAVEGLPQSLAIDLSGIDIGVRYLRSRPYAHLQNGEHFAWWRRFFAEAGAPMSRTPESW